jgi:hypothetical protein
VSLTFAGAAGTSGPAGCSVSASGAADAGSTNIAGTLDLTFVSCESAGLQPPARDQLTLTRQ